MWFGWLRGSVLRAQYNCRDRRSALSGCCKGAVSQEISSYQRTNLGEWRLIISMFTYFWRFCILLIRFSPKFSCLRFWSLRKHGSIEIKLHPTTSSTSNECPVDCIPSSDAVWVQMSDNCIKLWIFDRAWRFLIVLNATSIWVNAPIQASLPAISYTTNTKYDYHMLTIITPNHSPSSLHTDCLVNLPLPCLSYHHVHSITNHWGQLN